MCGIAGFFGKKRDGMVPEAALKRASERMKLRGPDAHGIKRAAGVGLVHRRLTVIDLEGGWQPMLDEPSGVMLTYNGEIYNFKELRAELETMGHSFQSHCDTEVLLRAWIEWGKGCLDRLVGIFAFAIYDPLEDLLFLARDRVGAKPLYYAETEAGLCFASSVAALLAFEGVRAEPDETALLHYFKTIRTCLGERTLLRDVKTLEPGHSLSVKRGGVLTRELWWEFPVVQAEDKLELPQGEAAERVRILVEQAVREQMVSDVPLGGFLSGGIDSTVIASIATQEGVFGAYSVGYGEHDCNEWPYIRFAAQTYHMPCKEIHLEGDSYLDTWQFLMREKGLPLSTPNEVPIYHLAHALKQDYTVALSGEGADEVFGGYVVPYFSSYDFDRARRNPLAEGEAPDRMDRAMMRFYQQGHLSSHTQHHFMHNSWIQPALLPSVLQPSILGESQAVDAHYGRLYDRFDGCSTLDKQMHVHARINLEGLLNRVDSSTMAASVEGRVPFTDHRLAEFLFAQPDRFRMDWKDETARIQGRVMNVAEIDQRRLVESKILLRRAFDRKIPRQILERKKVSFPVPFREWLMGPMKEMALNALNESAWVQRFVSPEVLDMLNCEESNLMHGMLLWPMVNLALWEKEIRLLDDNGS